MSRYEAQVFLFQFPIRVLSKSVLVLGMLLVFAFPFLCLPSASGQATSGTITGNITDESGASVPNATVTITDADRGTQFITTSNDQGLFLKAQVPNGRYTIRIEAPGFAPNEQQGVVVSVDQETRVYAKLKPGDVQQSVTVTADDQPSLITDRAEVSTTLGSQELNRLPILGQNVTQLELLSPGTVRNTYDISGNENPQGGNANNTNGLLFGFTNRQIDGADDMDAVLGISVVNPPPESLDEMKSTTSNYDAEFGRAGGAVVQYVTKSGTNRFHGSLFEYLRNNYFDAENPFTEQGGTLPLRFNQFGGSAGGPVIKNKLFFFGVYQGQRQRIGSGVVTTVPTVAERSGDLSAFSNQIYSYDPSTGTRTPLAGNVIPSGMIDPAASQLLALLPAPTNDLATGNFVGTGSVKFDTNQYDGRVDYYIGEKDRMFVRYDYFGSNILVPTAYGNVLGGPSVYGPLESGASLGRNQNLAVNYNHIFGPNLLMNVRYSYFRYRVDVEPLDLGLTTASDVGIPNINQGNTDTSGLSNFIFNGTGLSAASNVGGLTSGQPFQLGTSIGTNAPLHELEQLHQGSASVTKIMGNHNLKFGGDYRWMVNFRSASDVSRRGVFQFNADVTGDGNPADANTGDAFASFLLGQPSSFERFNFLGNPKEYEWDVFGFIEDQWRVTPKLSLTYGLRYEVYSAPYANPQNSANFDFSTGQLLVADVGNVNKYMNIDTRKTNFAPRVGIAYSVTPKTVIRAGYGRSYFPNFFSIQVSHNFPVNYSQDLTASTGVPLDFTLVQGPPLPVPPLVPPSGELPLPDGVSATGIPLDRKTASVDMWNVTVQREIAPGLTFQVGYVGNEARHLYSFINANAPVPGPGASNDNRPYFALFGYTQDLTNFCNCFSSDYNALQASVTKRFSRGYSLTAQYTFSKALNYGDNSAEFGPYNIQDQHGPAGFDRTHAFALGHVVELPFGPGKHFFQNMNMWERLLFSGWEFTGLTTVYSGRPFTPVLSSNSSLNSNFPLRPNEGGDPNRGVPDGLGFNPAVFSTPDPFVEGTAGRNSLRGPMFVDADWALGKSFQVTEGTRFQLSWQNFNVFNHPNLGLPNNVVDSSGAGQFTSLETFAMPRTMQLSLKFIF